MEEKDHGWDLECAGSGNTNFCDSLALKTKAISVSGSFTANAKNKRPFPHGGTVRVTGNNTRQSCF